MKREAKEISYGRLSQIKEPLRRQYSTLSTCEYPNEANNPIFGLPVSILEELNEQPVNTREKVKISQLLQPQTYGEIAMNYQQNLRKTVLNHTKDLFRRRNKSFTEKITLPTTLHLNNKSHSTIGYYQQYNSQTADTLSILHKVIMKDNGHPQPFTLMLPIQASKLPMLARKAAKKEKAKSLYFLKHRRESEKKQVVEPVKIVKYVKKVPAEKPYLTGWDLQDSPDF